MRRSRGGARPGRRSGVKTVVGNRFRSISSVLKTPVTALSMGRRSIPAIDRSKKKACRNDARQSPTPIAASSSLISASTPQPWRITPRAAAGHPCSSSRPRQSGLAHEALGNDSLARTDYQAALAVNPKNATAAERLNELKKPIYDRSKLPRRITVGLPMPPYEY